MLHDFSKYNNNFKENYNKFKEHYRATLRRETIDHNTNLIINEKINRKWPGLL